MPTRQTVAPCLIRPSRMVVFVLFEWRIFGCIRESSKASLWAGIGFVEPVVINRRLGRPTGFL